MNEQVNHQRIQRIAGIGLFLAMELILQLIGNIIAFGPININLSLIPIALCAMIYGPLGGAILGFVNGLVVLFSPSTMAVFMPISVFGTIVTCLFKCTIAGALGGLLFRLISKKNITLAAIIASLTVVIVNTGLFAVAALIFFREVLLKNSEAYANMYAFLFLGMIGWNFVFELGTTVVISPVVENFLNKSRHLKFN